MDNNLHQQNQNLNDNLSEPNQSLEENLSQGNEDFNNNDVGIGLENIIPILNKTAEYIQRLPESRIPDELRHNAIVIDTGAYDIKAGFQKEMAGKCPVKFRCVIGKNKYQELDQGNTYVGNEAIEKRAVLDVASPIGINCIEDWDGLKRIWDHTFENEIRIEGEDVSESPV